MAVLCVFCLQHLGFMLSLPLTLGLGLYRVWVHRMADQSRARLLYSRGCTLMICPSVVFFTFYRLYVVPPSPDGGVAMAWMWALHGTKRNTVAAHGTSAPRACSLAALFCCLACSLTPLLAAPITRTAGGAHTHSQAAGLFVYATRSLSWIRPSGVRMPLAVAIAAAAPCLVCRAYHGMAGSDLPARFSTAGPLASPLG